MNFDQETEKQIGKSISKNEKKWMLDERQGQSCMHPYMQFNISHFFTSPHPRLLSSLLDINPPPNNLIIYCKDTAPK